MDATPSGNAARLTGVCDRFGSGHAFARSPTRRDRRSFTASALLVDRRLAQAGQYGCPLRDVPGARNQAAACDSRYPGDGGTVGSRLLLGSEMGAAKPWLRRCRYCLNNFDPCRCALARRCGRKSPLRARRFVDLQLGTIWTFLEPGFPACGAGFWTSDVARCHTERGSVPTSIIRESTCHRPLHSQCGQTHIVPFDGVAIPFPDGSFDTILCTEVLEHAASRPR